MPVYQRNFTVSIQISAYIIKYYIINKSAAPTYTDKICSILNKHCIVIKMFLHKQK